MKTINQYETEKKVVKGVFWGMVALFLSILLAYSIYGDNICNVSICDTGIKYALPVSIMALIFLPIFFTKNVYSKWRKYLIFSTIIGALILIFDHNEYGDLMKPSRDAMSVSWSVFSFVSSSIYILKRRVFNK